MRPFICESWQQSYIEIGQPGKSSESRYLTAAAFIDSAVLGAEYKKYRLLRLLEPQTNARRGQGILESKHTFLLLKLMSWKQKKWTSIGIWWILTWAKLWWPDDWLRVLTVSFFTLILTDQAVQQKWKLDGEVKGLRQTIYCRHGCLQLSMFLFIYYRSNAVAIKKLLPRY